MKKTYILVFIALFITLRTYSQSRQVPNLLYFDNAKYHFGFLLGTNQMLFTIKTADDFQNVMYYNNNTKQNMPDLNCDSARLYNVEGRPSFGFVIGIIGNMRMSEHFDLRLTPSLSFGERRLQYDLLIYNEDETPYLHRADKDIQSTYIDFPLFVKYKGDRMHNVRPYVFAGAKYMLDLASNAKKKEKENAGYVFLNRNDFYAFAGAGFDIYTAYFKFGVEASMSYGIIDVIKRNDQIYTLGIEKLSSKIFQLSFTFE